MINLTRMGLLSLALSIQVFAIDAGVNTDLSSSEPVKFETTDNPLCAYEWRIDEKAEDGVFSDKAVFWFPPNPSWTPGMYHLTVKETCPGLPPVTDTVVATITPDPCPELSTLSAGADKTITDTTNVKLMATMDGECRPNADVSYTWTIAEYKGNGVYSDVEIYWFPSNRVDFVSPNTYHMTVKATDNVDPANTTSDEVEVEIIGCGE